MKHIRRWASLGCAIAMICAMCACGRADTRTQLTVWSWEPSMRTLITQFEHDNPDIHVNLVSNIDYNKLDSAIQDGYNTPDVVQLEYFALPQYAVSSQLVNISNKTKGYESFYTPGTWSSVQLDGNIYALPMDSGPMAFFYNDDVFREVGVDASKIRTWDDYYEAAKKLKSIGVYIAADAGDASFYNAMIWLAGGRPYKTSHDGKEVSIDLNNDKGTRTFTAFWQRMIDDGLINTRLSTWSNDWKKAVGSGKVASIFAGAWMPSLLLSDVPGGAGLWRVAQMPTQTGRRTNAENGGSSLAVLTSSRKPQAAYRFIEYVCHTREGIQTRVDSGAFPADNATLSSSEFLNKTTVKDARGVNVPYFGGQQYNAVLAQAAAHVSTGYQYLPFEVYARSDFRSTVGQAYKWANEEETYQRAKQRVEEGLASKDSIPQNPGVRFSLREGIHLWQADLQEYGVNQGFTVISK